MKRMKQALYVFMGCLLAASVRAAPAIEKPSVMPEAMVAVTVPDLHGFIDGMGSVIAKASPMMNGAFIKNMVGMQLGDPGMTGIAPGSGLSIVALDPTNVFAVVEVTEARLGAYTNALASKARCSYGDGLLVIAKTPEQVARGRSLAGAVKTKLLARREPVLRLALQPAAMAERNSEKIEGILKMIPTLMGQDLMKQPGATLESTQATLRVVEGELRILKSIASQCDTAEVVFAPENGSLRISKTLVPKAGTRFAALCSAPAVSKPHPKVRSGYLGKAAVAFDSSISNPEALMDFIIAEAEELDKAMELVDIDLPELVRKSAKFWLACGGSMSETVGFSTSGMNVGYLMDVRNETDALAAVKAMPVDMAPLMKLYESLGFSMQMEFKEDVRTYKDTAIHQFRMKMKIKNQPPEVAEKLASLNFTNMVYDIAVVDSIMIYAMGDVKVESVIDRLKDASFKSAPMKARQVYPTDGFYYLDFDVGEYLSFISSFLPATGGVVIPQQMMDMLKGVEPVTSAGFKADGCVMWSVNIPGDLIGKFGQIGMMMQMQKMQQQQMQAPSAVPGAMPQPAPQLTP